jgi:ketosteroid isomerase-like protein
MNEAAAELIRVAHDWDRAMTGNDAAEIGRYMADDWTIVGPDGSVTDKAAFLHLVETGRLTHDVMTSTDFHVRVYGGAAVVLTRGVSGGTYDGHPFHVEEWVSCLFVRRDGEWKCASTHLSRMA